MIQVEGLTKYYDDFCAVDRIDFGIQKGEIIGLLGPNGAGKTTTLRMLTGYFKPTAGHVKIKDFDIRNDIVAIKQLIGYLPESAPLYPGMLVYDYLDYVASIHKLSDDRPSATPAPPGRPLRAAGHHAQNHRRIIQRAETAGRSGPRHDERS